MKPLIARTALLALCSVILVLSTCASADDVLVNKEAGFYYGYASGPDEASATAKAFDDFIYSVLTESGSLPKAGKAKTVITQEMRDAFNLLKLKPFLNEKKDDGKYAVIFRIDMKDWDKAEQPRLAGLVTDLGGKFAALKAATGSPLAERLANAAALLVAINRHGVPLKLAETAGGTSLLYPAVETWCRDSVAGITWTLTPSAGLVTSSSRLELLASDAGGKPLAALPLTALWSAGSKLAAPLALSTDSSGKASFAVAGDPALKGQKLSLKLGTDFAKANTEVALLAQLDAGLVKEYAFRHNDDLAGTTADEVKVAGGSFAVGKVPQDSTFGVAAKEKVRQVTLKTFYMDRNLVTNAQYRTFLEATGVPKAKWPDYLDNEDFNQPEQPVVGVSVADAQAYAAWISGILGVTKRLPTEEEFEVAARGGALSIYPWGDQKPTDGVRANYSGNGKFSTTSPVGSFANGSNPLGLNDMAGNVWQWTASVNEDKAIAKGGSYMDGPQELRVSNRRFESGASGYADIGFRLIREAGNE